MLTLVWFVGIGLALVGVLIAVVGVFQIRAVLRIYRGASTRRLRELPAGRVLLPPPIEHQVAALERLGFVALPAVLGLDLPGSHAPVPERVLLSPDRATQVEIVAPDDKVLLAFATRHADGFVVETHYPENVRLVRPHVDLSGTTTSLEAAIDHHAARVSRALGSHGSPTLFETVADVLAFDADYRVRIAPTVLWLPTRKAILVNLLGIAAGLVLAVPTIVSYVR